MGSTSFPSSAIINVATDRALARLSSGSGKAEEVTLTALISAVASELPTREPSVAGSPWMNRGVLSLSKGRLHEQISYTAFWDAGYGTYQETSGAVADLTPSQPGDPVGTWVDRSDTYIVRAPSDAKRRTLVELSNGRRELVSTASGQYYASDDAASTWKWMHDGTTYSFACGFRPLPKSSDKIFPLFGTFNTFGSNIGAACWYDDRSSVPRSHYIAFDVATGTDGLQSVQMVAQPGVAGDKWQVLSGQVDPDNATAADRLTIWSYARESAENDKDDSPSSSDPQQTLHIGEFNTAASGRAVGGIAGLVLYQGTWSADDREAIDKFFDLDTFGRYSVTTAANNISGQADDYEAFPSIFEKTSDGSLVALWRSASSHVNSKGTITRGYSTDGGATWTTTPDVISHPTDDLRESNGLLLDSGKLLVGSNINVSGSAADAYISSSTDDGATFTNITTLATPSGYDFLFPYGDWHDLGGTVIAPIYTKRSSDSVNVSEVWQTSDEGQTWSRRSVVGEAINETAILNLQGTEWLACSRGQGAGTVGIWYSTSSDDAQTWSTPVDSGLKGVSPYLFRVGDTVYCAIGDRTSPGGISLLIWSDGQLHGGGASWLIYEAAAANTDEGYPAVVVDGQSVSAVFFDENAADPGIFFMQFDMPDFGSVL